MAEQAVDEVVRFLGAPSARPCATADTPLLPGPDAFSGVLPPEPSRQAVEHYCRNEWARHLDDVMVRRSNWQHYRPDAPDVAREALGWMTEFYGWSPDRSESEWRRYLAAARACTITTENPTHDPIPTAAAGRAAG
jgi:glycerol-3-phosphate dehydrogenase